MSSTTTRITLAAALAAAIAGCGEPQTEAPAQPRPVRAIKVGDVDAFDNTYLPGTARAAQEVDLSFRVAGPLVERPVNIGDILAAGTLVARIDPRDFEIDVRNAEGRLDEATATLTRAQGDLDRLLRIQKEDPGATSSRAVDKAREERDQARAAIKSREADLTAATDRLGYTALAAPFDATVVATYVENFTTVREKQSIVRLLDTRRIKFDVDVPERFISGVPAATNIVVEFDAFAGQPVPAEIFEVGSEASATTRTYRVTLLLSQPEGIQILAGMSGRASADPEASTGETPEITLPVSAVFSPDRGETSFVWIVDEQNMTVSRREVVARRIVDRGIVVEQGLEAGEWVATAGVHFLEEGQQVTFLDQPGG